MLTSLYLVHFNLRPKPWEGWQYHHLKYQRIVLEVIEPLSSEEPIISDDSWQKVLDIEAFSTAHGTKG